MRPITIHFDSSVYQAIPNENNQVLLSQKIQKYINSKKEVYNAVLDFLESPECNDDYFQNLIKNVDNQQYEKSQEEYEQFLYMIKHISNNHHRNEIFLKKVFQIVQYYKNQIKQTLSNLQIFNIFKSNKMILLFLIENEIIEINENICHSIISTYEKNGCRYCDFFYPEIKQFLDKSKIKEIETILLSKNENIFDHFDEYRHQGENNSYICTLIRQDSVEDFIQHVNRKNISLKSEIIPSIFETNPFLNDKNPTLIEYAAFFGSIQIFRYLMMNQVELTPSLWLYTIHSKNGELIHLLESNNVPPPKFDHTNNYIQCLIESIKCHHNDISEYIKNNYLIEFDKMDSEDYENIISCVLRYHNYFNFPNDFDKDDEFFYLSNFNYNEIVTLFVEKKEKFLKELIKRKKGNLTLNDITDYKTLIFYYSMLKQSFFDTSYYFNNYVMKKIVIPQSITIIKNNSFKNYKVLSQIIIPSSVTSIGEYSFDGCSSLTQITIPSSVTSIGSHAFRGCSSLTQITIPSSVTLIGNNHFLECTKLNQVTVIACNENRIEYFNNQLLIYKSKPSSDIYDTLVYSKNNLDIATIPSSIKTIESYAFSECLSLTRVTIPSSVTSIGSYVFSECSSLTQITIPSSVTLIRSHAFSGCSSLTQITIPSSVTLIESHAFSECSSLTQITIPSSVTSIGSCAFRGCSSLTQITIPSSVTFIRSWAFYDCPSLTQITIPSSINRFNLEIPSRANITTF